jgi:hypothetical protein
MEGYRFPNAILHAVPNCNKSQLLIFNQTVQIKYLILHCNLTSVVDLVINYYVICD